jgi:DNA-directed RNA polymerase specialized sigma24 family protein
MREGDREAAAVFVSHYGPRVRRRLRGKLSSAMRRVFDSQDLMSTFARRLDRFVHSGRVRAATEKEFWSLVFRIAENALIDKGRVFRRLESADAEDLEFAQTLVQRLREAEKSGPDGCELELGSAIRMLPDATDQTILSMWLNGTPHAVTAECVGLSAAAVRQRWCSIRARLRAGLGPGYAHG